MSNELAELTTQDLIELRGKYEGNDSIARLVDGIVEARLKTMHEVEVSERFANILDTTFNNPDTPLVPPDGIVNVFMRWGEVEVDKVVRTEGRGKNKVSVVEKVKEYRWIIEPNKVLTYTTPKGSAPSAPTKSKRAIKVLKIDGTSVTEIGKFHDGESALKFLGIANKGDSAPRVLSREGYITQPYDGVDYTA